VNQILHPKLATYIATRDKRIAKEQPWNRTELADAFAELCKGGAVKMGGRATCGTSVDPTWRVLVMWKEVVRKARSYGYVITEEPIKQGNSWATKAGGFWEESEYRLSAVEEKAA
jgi:hypothetical protein